MYYKLFSIFFKFFLVKPFFFFSFLGVNLKTKRSEWIIHGPHIHVKCLLISLGFWHMQKMNILYSQMRFQLYRAHIMSVIGLKSGKKSINWVSVGVLETLR